MRLHVFDVSDSWNLLLSVTLHALEWHALRLLLLLLLSVTLHALK